MLREGANSCIWPRISKGAVVSDQKRNEAIRDELYVLYKEAEANRCAFLAYLLGMAVQEANSLVANGSTEPAPARRVA